MPRKFLFLILILFGFTLLIYTETIPKAEGGILTNQFGPNQLNPKLALFADPIRGDANADGQINAGDVVYLILYLFKGGPPPALENGDVNGDGVIDLVDVVYLFNYLFQDGPPPPQK
jgi:hypothetical protein